MSHKKIHKKQKSPLFILAGILLIIWPCLVHMDNVRTGLSEMPWYPDVTVQGDFFMHVRSVSLLAISVLMLLALVDRILLQRISRLNFRTSLPLIAYAVLAVVSAILSVNRDFSFNGSAEQFETIWVLLGYLVICWYFSDTVKNFSCKNQLIGYLLSGAALQGAIGLSQVLGHDFWSSNPGTRLILLGQDSSRELTFAFADEGTTQVYMSFYNPNYAAVYVVLVLPFAVYGAIAFKKIWQKALSILLILMLLVCLWGTESEAGLITLCALVFSGVLLFFRDWKNRLRFGTICVVCLIYLVIQGFTGSEDSAVRRIVENVFPEQKHYKLEEIVPGQDDVRITFANREYSLKIEREDEHIWFSVTDESGMSCRLDYDDRTGRFTFADEEYENLEFEVYVDGEEFTIIMYRLNIPWQFVKKDAKSPYEYITLYGKADVPENAEYAFGKGYERALTGRVYLWSRSVPLLKDYLLVGSGPDTFSLVFPQNDYVTRANIGIKMLTEIISKPHSYYLQTAVQTGLLSLLMLLWFFGKYLFGSFRQLYSLEEGGSYQVKGTGAECSKSQAFLQQKKTEDRLYVITIMLSVIGFLIMGIANDSVVVTTPVFWAILGIGCGNLSRKQQ